MFLYYIVDSLNGIVDGTNDKVEAENCALSEDYYVISVADNNWIQADMARVPIIDIKDQS